MSGFGGAGAFSDGKYNITNDFGGTLYEYIGKEKAIDSVIVEGGATLLWSFFSQGLVDREQAYIAPKIFGGVGAPSPIQGLGVETPANAIQCSTPTITQLGQDILLECEVQKCLPE